MVATIATMLHLLSNSATASLKIEVPDGYDEFHVFYNGPSGRYSVNELDQNLVEWQKCGWEITVSRYSETLLGEETFPYKKGNVTSMSTLHFSKGPVRMAVDID